MRYFFFILFFIVETAFAAVNPPVLFDGSSVVRGEVRNPVLIYYANETAPTDREALNYEVLSGWLRESRTKIGAMTADRWASDLKKFPETVDKELVAIEAMAASSADGVLSIVIASNRAARAGYLQVYNPKMGWRKLPFVAPVSGNYIENSNVLADSKSLEQVLAITAKEFPPAKHSFLLHIKSHGAATHVVSTNISRQYESMIKTDLIASLVKADEALLESGRAEEVEAAHVGITKEQFFQILKDAGRRGMVFPLVFLESCRSGLSLRSVSGGMKSVGFLISSDQRGIGYENINYSLVSTEKRSSIYQEYYRQLVTAAKKSHSEEYGIDLSVPEDFVPRGMTYFKYWARALF